MPNYYLSVLYKHIIQVENKNVGLKVGGAQTYHCPPSQKSGGGTCPPCPPASYASDNNNNNNNNKEGRKEMFYLTTYSTHFIYGYMASDIW